MNIELNPQWKKPTKKEGGWLSKSLVITEHEINDYSYVSPIADRMTIIRLSNSKTVANEAIKKAIK